MILASGPDSKSVWSELSPSSQISVFQSLALMTDPGDNNCQWTGNFQSHPNGLESIQRKWVLTFSFSSHVHNAHLRWPLPATKMKFRKKAFGCIFLSLSYLRWSWDLIYCKSNRALNLGEWNSQLSTFRNKPRNNQTRIANAVQCHSLTATKFMIWFE